MAAFKMTIEIEVNFDTREVTSRIVPPKSQGSPKMPKIMEEDTFTKPAHSTQSTEPQMNLLNPVVSLELLKDAANVPVVLSRRQFRASVQQKVESTQEVTTERVVVRRKSLFQGFLGFPADDMETLEPKNKVRKSVAFALDNELYLNKKPIPVTPVFRK